MKRWLPPFLAAFIPRQTLLALVPYPKLNVLWEQYKAAGMGLPLLP